MDSGVERSQVIARRIVIVGGGPAGVAAAITLRQLAPAWGIALVHRAARGAWRPGEILAPGAETILQSLGLWAAFCAAGFPESTGTRAAWGSDAPYENEFLFSPRGPGWRLDRERFDALLLDAARNAGVDCFDGTSASGDVDFTIDATGRAATVAVARGASRIVSDSLVGIGRIFEGVGSGTAAPGYTLVESREDGWWYSTVLPDGRMVVAWMTDADLARRERMHESTPWLKHLECSRATAARVADAHPVTGPVLFTARSQRLAPCVGDDWLAAGDAAAAFDPLSSQGILRALRSGKIAAYTAFDALRGRPGAIGKYRAYVQGEYKHYGSSKREFYGMERRWPEAPFWARRTGDPMQITQGSESHDHHDQEPIRAF